jgi:NitT/TauT family transport system substrate-binding protein
MHRFGAAGPSLLELRKMDLIRMTAALSGRFGAMATAAAGARRGAAARGIATGCLLAALSLLTIRPAQADGVEQPNLAVMLDWVIQGTHAPFFVAERNGYYKQAGLTVRFDPGKGAGAVCAMIASGAYPIGYADVPTIAQFDARNPPDKALVAIYVSFDETPLALVGLKKSGIRTVADINGKRIATPANSATVYSLPILLKAAHAQGVTVNWQFVAPQLMAPMLVRGETDLLGGFTNSQIVAVRELGVPMPDIQVLRFADYVHMYGLALFTTKKFADANPKTLAAFVRAVNKGMLDTIADPEAAIALMKQRDPMMHSDLELERLNIALGHTVTNHVREYGLSSVTTARMQETIDDVNAAQPLPRKLTVADIWTDRFLPPAAERKLPPMAH